MNRKMRRLTHRERLMKWHRISEKNINRVLEYEREKGVQYDEAVDLIAAIKTAELKYGFSYEDAIELKKFVDEYIGT